MTIWKRTEVDVALNTFLVFIQTLVNGWKKRELRSYYTQWKSNLPENGNSLTNCYVCNTYMYQLITSVILNNYRDATNTYSPNFIRIVMSVIWDNKKSKFLFSPWHLLPSVHWQLLRKLSCHAGEKTLSSELLTRKLQSKDSQLCTKREILNAQLAYKIRR